MTETYRIRRPLPHVACPLCGTVLQACPGRIVSAENWLDCHRRCSICRVGISNARRNPTIIFDDPRLNVPHEVRNGVLQTLSLALNVRNRENKKTKFGFSTSEDALTWTLFKFLSGSRQLAGVLRSAGLPIPDCVTQHDALLLWGVPIPMDEELNPNGWELRRCLESISDLLGEDPTSRTEPDVIIDFGARGLFIIEVKHRSGTNLKRVHYQGWDRYYATHSPLPYAAAMRFSECYELARNWRFGLELSANPPRPFTMVYLGPDTLFHSGELAAFEAALPTTGTAQFKTLTWNHLVGSISERPQWLAKYVQSREYDFGREAM
jgi:hypothetical protein